MPRHYFRPYTTHMFFAFGAHRSTVPYSLGAWLRALPFLRCFLRVLALQSVHPSPFWGNIDPWTAIVQVPRLDNINFSPSRSPGGLDMKPCCISSNRSNLLADILTLPYTWFVRGPAVVFPLVKVLSSVWYHWPSKSGIWLACELPLTICPNLQRRWFPPCLSEKVCCAHFNL